MAIIITWKKEGLSMGEHLESLKLTAPATYAGRLDPLASGVCIVLSNSDRYRKEEFLALDKEYLVTSLFGISTDTSDPLGLVMKTSNSTAVTKPDIQTALTDFTPGYTQIPPAYSSIPIEGQPSFIHARQKTGVGPKGRPVSIGSISLVDYTTVETADLVPEIIDRVQRVRGDFRQAEITASWQKSLPQLPETLDVCKLRVTCGSGTYMRSLARDLGTKLNTPCIALRIMRTRVGDFTLPFVE